MVKNEQVFINYFFSFIPSPEVLWQFDMDDSSFGMTAAGDIDGNGKLELVFGCYRNDDNIYALNAEDGSLLWKYNATLDAPDGCNDVAPILFDIDGDGILEVIVPSSCNAIVTCFNGKDGVVDGVSIEIYDVMGILIQTDIIHPMFPKHRMYIENLAPGIYFVKIINSSGACSIVEKFVKM